MCDCQSLTTLYKFLSLIGPLGMSIKIYQPYLVSSENTPREQSVDVINKNMKNNVVKPGGISNEPVLHMNVNIKTIVVKYLIAHLLQTVCYSKLS